MAKAQRFRDEKRLRPLHGLSPEWLDAAVDGTPEYELALALSGIYDEKRKIGPLRANLEPTDWKRFHPTWAEKDRSVVWNSDDRQTLLEGLDGLPYVCSQYKNDVLTTSYLEAHRLSSPYLLNEEWAKTLAEEMDLQDDFKLNDRTSPS